jgi:hypothetical protein
MPKLVPSFTFGSGIAFWGISLVNRLLLKPILFAPYYDNGPVVITPLLDEEFPWLTHDGHLRSVGIERSRDIGHPIGNGSQNGNGRPSHEGADRVLAANHD